jgi:hypothetical protein
MADWLLPVVPQEVDELLSEMFIGFIFHDT